MAEPVYSKTCSGPASHADLGDQRQDDILGRYAFRQGPFHANFAGLRFSLQQALRGQDMLDLGSADPKGQRTKGSMRGSVTVAADDGHPGRVKPSSGPITWTMPRCGLFIPYRRHSELGGIGFHLFDLCRSQGIRNGQGWRSWVGMEWSIVATVFSGRRTFESAFTQAGEGLRRSDFMDQVQVNIQDGR